MISCFQHLISIIQALNIGNFDPYEIIFSFLKTRMIKIEEESFQSSTEGDVIKLLTHFHDDESVPEYYNQLNQVQEHQPIYGTSQLIDYIDSNLDIRTTPMRDIEQFVDENCPLNQADKRVLASGILKKKRILKRQRAKNRAQNTEVVKLQNAYYKPNLTSGMIDLTGDQLQKKKKRNRISAQISRDRKKQYLVELEQENKRLSEVTHEFRKQNEQLKQKIADLNNKKITSLKQQNGFQGVYQPKNRFFKLLIFLGIIFLFTSLKEVVNVNKFSGLSKKRHSTSISCEQQSSLIGKVQSLFGGFSEEMNQIGGGLKSEVCRKLQGLKRRNSPVSMSSEMYEGLLYSTASLEN